MEDTPTLEFPMEYTPDQERLGMRYTRPATDSKGHSSQIKILVPQGHIIPRVKALVNSGRLGYRSEGDFYRRAIYETLEEDEAEAGLIPTIGKQLQILDEINQEAERHRESREAVVQLIDKIEQCLLDGEVEEAETLLALSLETIEAAPEGPWKRRTIIDFSNRFKPLMGEGE